MVFYLENDFLESPDNAPTSEVVQPPKDYVSTGVVIGLTTDVIDIHFDKLPPQIGIILQTESGAIISTEAAINEKVVRAVILSQNASIALGEKIYSTGKPLQAPVGKSVLGRIFNVFGEPIDGKPVDPKQQFADVEVVKTSVNRGEFVIKDQRIFTGIKVIDFFIPTLEGDKIGMFGGAGVGKTLVIKEIINNLTKKNHQANSIFVGIGERSREGEELYRELKESKLLDKVSLVFAQMNGTPGARMKVIYTALTMAEHFRDVEKQDTFMFIDNVYRYIQAGSEISSSLGRIPAQSGYQPTLASEISIVQERISNSKTGSITAFETVFIPADDITDPAVIAIFSHLDGSLVLDRKYASEGKYPAISPLHSSSNNLTEGTVGKRHLAAVTDVKRHLQRYEELADLLAVLGQDGISVEDQNTVKRARMLQNFFTQNLFVAELYTQRKGDFITVEETIAAVERIMAGEFDEIDPVEFLYIGNIEIIEMKQKAFALEKQKELEKRSAVGTKVKKVKLSKADKIYQAQQEAEKFQKLVDEKKNQRLLKEKSLEAKDGNTQETPLTEDDNSKK